MSYDHQLKLDEIFNPEAECIDDLDERIFLFVEKCFEIALGENAINRDFTPSDVIWRLQTFSEQSRFLEGIAAPLLRDINLGDGDSWEADLSYAIELLDNLGV